LVQPMANCLESASPEGGGGVGAGVGSLTTSTGGAEGGSGVAALGGTTTGTTFFSGTGCSLSHKHFEPGNPYIFAGVAIVGYRNSILVLGANGRSSST
jgi:hypothetical protein